MEITAIIQARMGSERLPGKILKPLSGKPVLWHVVSRIKKARLVNKVVVATTGDKKDNAVERFCLKNTIPVFRGSNEDVLDRYYQCARKFKAAHIARVTADCPLHDPCVIDDVIGEYSRGDWDYVSNVFRKFTFPDGLDVEVFSFNTLEDAWKNARLPSEREHVTPYIINKKGFRKKNVASPVDYSGYRLTLDCKEDYTLIKAVYRKIGRDFFHLEKVLDTIKRDPRLYLINSRYKRNEGYLKSLRMDKKLRNSK